MPLTGISAKAAATKFNQKHCGILMHQALFAHCASPKTGLNDVLIITLIGIFWETLMELHHQSPQSRIAGLREKIDMSCEEGSDLLLSFVGALDAWQQEDMLFRLGHRADPEVAADTVFRAWHKLSNEKRIEIAKLGGEEDYASELGALTGNYRHD